MKTPNLDREIETYEIHKKQGYLTKDGENYLAEFKAIKQALIIDSVSNSSEHKERIEAYKECFETYIPNDKWDEATLFLSTYGSGLAKDLARREL